MYAASRCFAERRWCTSQTETAATPVLNTNYLTASYGLVKLKISFRYALAQWLYASSPASGFVTGRHEETNLNMPHWIMVYTACGSTHLLRYSHPVLFCKLVSLYLQDCSTSIRKLH